MSWDPTQGSEIQKTRPCLVVSPNEANKYLSTVIIAPMTTTERPYPTRVGITFQGKRGQVALDQIRAVDRQRLVRKLGAAPAKTAQAVASVLMEMFASQGERLGKVSSKLAAGFGPATTTVGEKAHATISDIRRTAGRPDHPGIQSPSASSMKKATSDLLLLDVKRSVGRGVAQSRVPYASCHAVGNGPESVAQAHGVPQRRRRR